MKRRHWFLTTLVAVVFILHQDFWNWKSTAPLLFGLFPPGLTYHLGYSILAAITMALLVKYAWPKDLDSDDQSPH